MGVYAQRRFIANYSYFFRYSVALRACSAGWCGGDVARGGDAGYVLQVCRYAHTHLT